MPKPNHSPLPWYVVAHEYIGSADHRNVAQECEIEDQDVSNIRFIVRACNNHYQLIEALDGVLHLFDKDTTLPEGATFFQLDKARETLAKAKGESYET